jgi:hypothetical protein
MRNTSRCYASSSIRNCYSALLMPFTCVCSLLSAAQLRGRSCWALCLCAHTLHLPWSSCLLQQRSVAVAGIRCEALSAASADMLVCAGFKATAALLAAAHGKIGPAAGSVSAHVLFAQVTATACSKSWVLRLYLAPIRTPYRISGRKLFHRHVASASMARMQCYPRVRSSQDTAQRHARNA